MNTETGIPYKKRKNSNIKIMTD